MKQFKTEGAARAWVYRQVPASEQEFTIVHHAYMEDAEAMQRFIRARDQSEFGRTDVYIMRIGERKALAFASYGD